jgi:hypothetical protein
MAQMADLKVELVLDDRKFLDALDRMSAAASRRQQSETSMPGAALIGAAVCAGAANTKRMSRRDLFGFGWLFNGRR